MQESEISEGSNDHLDSDGSVIVYNNEPDRLKKKTKKDLKRKVSNFQSIIFLMIERSWRAYAPTSTCQEG